MSEETAGSGFYVSSKVFNQKKNPFRSQAFDFKSLAHFVAPVLQV